MSTNRPPPKDPLVDRAAALEMLRAGMPDWQWFLQHLEEARGRLKLNAGLARAIRNFKVETYPVLYEREASIGTALVLALAPEQAARDIDATLRAATPVVRGSLVLEIGRQLSALVDEFEFPATPAFEQEARIQFEELSAEDRKEAVRCCQLLLAGGLAVFYQQLSLMVHGEKLTSLVAQAKAGNDLAFAKAVQIDGRILTEVPYFRERIARARLEDEAGFIGLVWRRQVAAPYRGRIEHKALYLMFSFLDMMGLLQSFTHSELLDLYEDLGVGGQHTRIADVKNMTKRLAEYRRFQNRQRLSTP
jgi:hypothetical protein